ncbi:MAG: ATP-grasp domain-containing protein, partial [Gemmatimonadota bacterium]|nr:ATP-grasp domain-containing protein [Gemmatimonadota bacterium]
RAALAVVRSLGRAGYTVCVAASARVSLAGASRYARYRDVAADPTMSPARFVDDVVHVTRRRGIDVLVPVTDAALLSLTRERGRLGGVCLPWPDADAVLRMGDKALVAAAAREIGIAVPAQRVVATPDEALAASRDLRFPLVLKPSRSVRERLDGRFAKVSVAHAARADELALRLAELGAGAFPALLQERIVGPGVGVSLLMWDGRALAHFSHRRLREQPPAGGVSVYAESIPPDMQLVERSAALLGRFAWRGVAMVEYKVDATTGTPYLMEVNGRFWGSLQLAIDAGVDFPLLLLSAARGVAEPVPGYRAGLRFRWWWGDVDHLLFRLFRSPTRLSLPPGAPSRGTALRDFVAAGPPHRASDVLHADDPRPFLVETLDWLAERAVRGTQGIARGGWRRVREWWTSSPGASRLA